MNTQEHTAENDVLIEAATYRSHALTARLVTARKSHRCDYSRDVSWGRACHTVMPGEQYVRVTVFPGHDFLDTQVPTSGACCLPCAEGYDGFSTLAVRVIPPAKPRPRCPVCNRGLRLWATVVDAVRAECDRCGWEWRG